MKILIACEESGTVREAFNSKGHNVWSCDILPTRRPGKHFQCDVFEALKFSWDMLIAFPPCTDLCVSGARHFAAKRADGRQQRAIRFFLDLAAANVAHIAIENPVGIMSTHYRKPDQIIQPWQFGHGETKATCLWLKNLPALIPTNIVSGRLARIHKMPPGPDRARERSITYPGIAEAMSEQWGNDRAAEIWPAPSEKTHCPHGRIWEDCAPCLEAADREFDARREQGRI